MTARTKVKKEKSPKRDPILDQRNKLIAEMARQIYIAKMATWPPTSTLTDVNNAVQSSIRFAEAFARVTMPTAFAPVMLR